ncbi:MAG: hypothetical protein HC890_14500 [Chloroflexaceae bacterium]|nr:hypothetical protein [Chloroflexaceae bacterium]
MYSRLKQVISLSLGAIAGLFAATEALAIDLRLVNWNVANRPNTAA